MDINSSWTQSKHLPYKLWRALDISKGGHLNPNSQQFLRRDSGGRTLKNSRRHPNVHSTFLVLRAFEPCSKSFVFGCSGKSTNQKASEIMNLYKTNCFVFFTILNKRIPLVTAHVEPTPTEPPKPPRRRSRFWRCHRVWNVAGKFSWVVLWQWAMWKTEVPGWLEL